MRFLIDAQLPRRLARHLVEAGHDATHTLDLPQRNATTDDELARVADAEGRVVVSKDADFVTSQLLRGTPGRLLVVATGNLSNDALIDLFVTHATELVAALEESRRVELRREGIVLYDATLPVSR